MVWVMRGLDDTRCRGTSADPPHGPTSSQRVIPRSVALTSDRSYRYCSFCCLCYVDLRPHSFTVTMASGAVEETTDPFRDPELADNRRAHAPQDVPATLAVGRNASLTLGTDALIILGMCCYHNGAECQKQALTGCRRGSARKQRHWMLRRISPR